MRGEAMRENAKSLTLRLSTEEYDHLCRLAKLSGLKLEPAVRSLIMGAQLRPRPPETWTAILRQLSGIGTNINQIAKVANTCGYISTEEIASIVQMQAQIWQMVKTL